MVRRFKVYLLFFFIVNLSTYAQMDDIRPFEVMKEVDSTLLVTSREDSQEARSFMSKVIQAKRRNSLNDLEGFTCDRYEKINVGWIDLNEKERDRIFFRYFKFLFENTDTSDVTNQPVQYVLSREKLEEIAYRQGDVFKRTIKGINRDWVDDVIGEQGIKAISDEAFSGFSIYDNDIKLLLQSFVSPLSSTLAKGFYRYSLEPGDCYIGNVPCKVVDFEPLNPRMLGFRGRLYVVNDSTYAIRRVVMKVLNEQNLNFVDNVIIMQDYGLNKDGYWLLSKDDISIEVALLKAFTRRISYYSGYKLNEQSEEEYRKRQNLVYTKDAWNHPEDYWQEVRPQEVSEHEYKVKQQLNTMLDENKGSVLGYIGASLIDDSFDFGKFELGPIYSMVSKNDIEGFRFRLGGTTTYKFNRNLFLEGYAAYGTEDKTWKYYAQAEYCFDKRNEYPTEFPVHSVALSIKKDVSFPGQDLVSVNKENVFYSFRRFPIKKMYLIKNIGMRYMHEYQTGFSYKFNLDVYRENPLGELYFDKPQPDGGVKRYNSLSTTELGMVLRYAPDERFYQRRYSRFYITQNNPVLTLSHKVGLKGVFGARYVSNLTEFAVFQRFRASAFGYFDVMFKGGKQWNEVPYPYLIIPQANPSYIHVKETFDLMNVMEFISDQYLSWEMEYNMNGLLFNMFPVNRYLKFREVVSFKGYMGTLSDKNNPAENPKAFLFPTDQSGNPVCYKMDGMPYMEVGVGIDNIFRFMRIDYVWRLTYRDHPQISRSGLRIGVNLQF